MSIKVLVISPHPDDETLGAGGTLLRHKYKGDRIFWLNVTDMKEEYGYSPSVVKRRTEEINRVIKAYGFEDFFNLRLKPASLTEADIPKIIDLSKDFIERVRPQVVYIPFYGDAHSDHRIVFQAFKHFFKPFRYPFIEKVLMMEIISETDQQWVEVFKPNFFVDISQFIDQKLEILKIYSSELGEHPFPRNLENVKALALYRGSQCNCKYAESFILLRGIERSTTPHRR